MSLIFFMRVFTSEKQVRGGLFRPKLNTNGPFRVWICKAKISPDPNRTYKIITPLRYEIYLAVLFNEQVTF
jgi:hypothetical protein